MRLILSVVEGQRDLLALEHRGIEAPARESPPEYGKECQRHRRRVLDAGTVEFLLGEANDGRETAGPEEHAVCWRLIGIERQREHRPDDLLQPAVAQAAHQPLQALARNARRCRVGRDQVRHASGEQGQHWQCLEGAPVDQVAQHLNERAVAGINHEVANVLGSPAVQDLRDFLHGRKLVVTLLKAEVDYRLAKRAELCLVPLAVRIAEDRHMGHSIRRAFGRGLPVELHRSILRPAR